MMPHVEEGYRTIAKESGGRSCARQSQRSSPDSVAAYLAASSWDTSKPSSGVHPATTDTSPELWPTRTRPSKIGADDGVDAKDSSSAGPDGSARNIALTSCNEGADGVFSVTGWPPSRARGAAW